MSEEHIGSTNFLKFLHQTLVFSRYAGLRGISVLPLLLRIIGSFVFFLDDQELRIAQLELGIKNPNKSPT